MKRILFGLLFLCVNTTFAQEAKKNVRVPKIANKEDAIILNLTSDNWSKQLEWMETKPFRSRGFSFLFMGEHMGKNGNAGTALGIGISSQNVHSNAFVDLSSGNSYTKLSQFPDSIHYDLNKLSLNYLDLAFELRFRTNENKHQEQFKVSIGIKGGWLMQSHTKYSDSSGKMKTYDIPNLNKFQYGLTGRIGYAHWGINGYYSMMSIFKKDKGPELVPFSVGISYTI